MKSDNPSASKPTRCILSKPYGDEPSKTLLETGQFNAIMAKLTIVESLAKRLEAALDRIAALESQLGHRVSTATSSSAESKYAQEQPAQPTTPSQHPVTYASIASSPTKYYKPGPKPVKYYKPGPRPIPIPRVQRLFSPPTEPKGYKFLYLSQKGRVPTGEIRRSLSAIGIINSRIIDVHAPTQNTCGILVHHDYAPEVVEKFKQHGIKILEEFNPTDANTIRDPEHANKTITERTDIAKKYP
ncbi:hypothetical protein INT47_006632 [Mucor saturninus]|uniref:Uncharacterized protein n=1 Tax=Mucor saturninus TaxID=64648 RepID=A0A8H7QH34_9FUNG|nr:hypothetical protein INT47_006632 [Mucor saturninus]